jgi:hypothetical protein
VQPTVTNRRRIIELAALHRLPAVYTYRFEAAESGPYRPDGVDLCRRSTACVDRIVKGEKPANLPVQQPTKYEPVINLKTAKSLASLERFHALGNVEIKRPLSKFFREDEVRDLPFLLGVFE